MIAVGSKAPDFAVKDQDGEDVRLSNFKGKRVLLSFRPMAWTPVCRDQMRLLEHNLPRLEKLNTVALGIGVDSVPSNKAWAATMEVKTTKLLSDFWPHGQVATAYGVFREKDGFSERANLVIDENGIVAFARVYQLSQVPDFEEVAKFLGRASSES